MWNVSDKSQLRDILQNIWPELFKSAKPSKTLKKSEKLVPPTKESETQWLTIMWYPGQGPALNQAFNPSYVSNLWSLASGNLPQSTKHPTLMPQALWGCTSGELYTLHSLPRTWRNKVHLVASPWLHCMHQILWSSVYYTQLLLFVKSELGVFPNFQDKFAISSSICFFFF